jgi:hemolysin activation/secretion protein
MKYFFSLIFFILIPNVLQASDSPVDAGIILQNIKSVAPNTASSPIPSISIKQKNDDNLQPSKPFMVKKLHLIGNTYFDTATLHSLVADAEGKMLSLSELVKLAAHITDYYNNNGYPLTRAIIPAQTIHEGIVSIQIIEVTYNKINVNNTSRVNDALLQDTLSPLKEGQAITQVTLDHTLLLLSDIPGVVCNATLKSGDKVATSDLIINVTPTSMVSGNVIVDNYGNRYTGRDRISATVNVNNSFHHGDTINLSALSSGRGLNYGRVAYESTANGSGTQIGGSYSALHYTLGEPIAFLNAHGTAQVETLWIRHPLIRTQMLNLYTLLEYDNLELHDHTDVTSTKTDRHLQNGTLSFNMDMRDPILSGAISTLNVGLTIGYVEFEDTAAQQYDAQTANTQGRFSKLNVYLSRLQRLSPKDEFQIDFLLQEASTNLDSSAKIVAGGPFSLRGYDVGSIAGDSWNSTTAEIRHTLDPIGEEKFQIIAFIERANIKVNKKMWSMGENHTTLSDVGVGINWNGSDQWSGHIYTAIEVGATSALVESSPSPKLWVEIKKEF